MDYSNLWRHAELRVGDELPRYRFLVRFTPRGSKRPLFLSDTPGLPAFVVPLVSRSGETVDLARQIALAGSESRALATRRQG